MARWAWASFIERIRCLRIPVTLFLHIHSYLKSSAEQIIKHRAAAARTSSLASTQLAGCLARSRRQRREDLDQSCPKEPLQFCSGIWVRWAQGAPGRTRHHYRSSSRCASALEHCGLAVTYSGRVRFGINSLGSYSARIAVRRPGVAPPPRTEAELPAALRGLSPQGFWARRNSADGGPRGWWSLSSSPSRGPSKASHCSWRWAGLALGPFVQLLSSDCGPAVHGSSGERRTLHGMKHGRSLRSRQCDRAARVELLITLCAVLATMVTRQCDLGAILTIRQTRHAMIRTSTIRSSPTP